MFWVIIPRKQFKTFAFSATVEFVLKRNTFLDLVRYYLISVGIGWQKEISSENPFYINALLQFGAAFWNAYLLEENGRNAFS